jgi:hypothetical protein
MRLKFAGSTGVGQQTGPDTGDVGALLLTLVC